MVSNMFVLVIIQNAPKQYIPEVRMSTGFYDLGDMSLERFFPQDRFEVLGAQLLPALCRADRVCRHWHKFLLIAIPPAHQRSPHPRREWGLKSQQDVPPLRPISLPHSGQL